MMSVAYYNVNLTVYKNIGSISIFTRGYIGRDIDLHRKYKTIWKMSALRYFADEQAT